jgi:exopolysaccharide biosynthesis polyprenyl glycosylphosphotransferase
VTTQTQTGPGTRVGVATPVDFLPLATGLRAIPAQGTPAHGQRLARRVRTQLVLALTDVHASNRSLVTAAVDLLVLVAVLLVFPSLSTRMAVASALAIVCVGYLGPLYGDRDSIQTRGVLWYPAIALPAVGLAAFVGAGSGLLTGHKAVLLMLAAGLGLFGVRLIAWLTLSMCRSNGHGMIRTVVVGSGNKADTVVRKLVEFGEGGLVPVAKIGLEALALPRGLEQAVRAHRAQHVVLVPTHSDDIDLVAHLQRNRGLDARFSIVPPMGDLFLHPGRVNELGGIPFIALGRVLRTRNRFPGKRAFDLLASATLLLLLSPVLAAAAVAVRLCDGGPVLFRQRRVGKGGETFGMLKFRSMVVGADALRSELESHNVTDGLLFRVSDDPRVTRVGRVLRRLSVDELPQLWNVFRGDMSLVGPRPLPVDPDAFSQGDAERHTVLPGITGYWQISGGNGLAYQEMVTLDLAYIRNWSLWLDLRLLLRTLPALVHRHDPC